MDDSFCQCLQKFQKICLLIDPIENISMYIFERFVTPASIKELPLRDVLSTNQLVYETSVRE